MRLNPRNDRKVGGFDEERTIQFLLDDAKYSQASDWLNV